MFPNRLTKALQPNQTNLGLAEEQLNILKKGREYFKRLALGNKSMYKMDLLPIFTGLICRPTGTGTLGLGHWNSGYRLPSEPFWKLMRHFFIIHYFLESSIADCHCMKMYLKPCQLYFLHHEVSFDTKYAHIPLICQCIAVRTYQK